MEEFFNEYNTSNLLYTYFILDVPRDVIKIYSINKLFKKCIDNNKKYFKSLFYTPQTNTELYKSVRNYIKKNNSLKLPHISKWNTYLITDMKNLFSYSNFNEDISNWNVSNVKNMHCMFHNASKFNQELNWDVYNVINTHCMFLNAISFNQELNWNVSNVINKWSIFNMFNNSSGKIC